MRNALAALALLAVTACAEPVAPLIDGSSEGAYVTSLREVRDALTAPDRLRFEAALKVIQADVFAKAKTRAAFGEAMRQRLDGKSALAVIAEGAAQTRGLSDKAVDAVFDAKALIGEEAKKLADTAKGN